MLSCFTRPAAGMQVDILSVVLLLWDKQAGGKMRLRFENFEAMLP